MQTESQTPFKVLAIDDSPTNLMSLEAALECFDVLFVGASSGAEGLRLVKEDEYGLILLDVQMPDMDGFEVARQLQHDPITAGIPIIFITAMASDREAIIKGYDVGGTDYITKPVHIKILRSKIKIFLTLEKQKQALKEAQEELEHHLNAKRDEHERLLEDHAELTNISTLDALTGLQNKKSINDALAREFQRAKRYNSALTVMMLDIDHFKTLNDSFGHPFGDLVLSGVGKIINTFSRASDAAGRYGGEEFLVILPNTNVSGATIYADNLIKAIRDHKFQDSEIKTNITASIGVAQFHGELSTPEELLELADQALYQAKEAGRNRAVFSGDDEDCNSQHYRDSVASLRQKCMTLEQHMRQTYVKSINALMKAIEKNDGTTRRHSAKVAFWARELSQALTLTQHDVDIIHNAAMLQDIGEMVLPDTLLYTDKALSVNELEEMRKHPSLGVDILSGIRLLTQELELIKHHHEHYDGSGYPDGLKGDAIPLGSRILAVVDAFCAMTTNESYRAVKSNDETVNELIASKHTQFDPDIVDVFVGLLQDKDTVATTPTTPIVLIVDDEEPLRQILAKVVKACGGEVKFATNGLEAVREATSKAYDLILLDFSIPGMTGTEVLGKIRNATPNKHTNVVIISGNLTNTIEDELRNLRVSHILHKPFDVAHLQELLSPLIATVSC